MYSRSPKWSSRPTSKSLFCLRNGKFFSQCRDSVKTEGSSSKMRALPSPQFGEEDEIENMFYLTFQGLSDATEKLRVAIQEIELKKSSEGKCNDTMRYCDLSALGKKKDMELLGNLQGGKKQIVRYVLHTDTRKQFDRFCNRTRRKTPSKQDMESLSRKIFPGESAIVEGKYGRKSPNTQGLKISRINCRVSF